MVRSMIAGVAGLKTHQSKLDVIGNNIANVNTWGFKSGSFNFSDSMYSTSINGSGGNDLAGGSGGRNASQVGYGVTTGSITTSFTTGAPAPSANPLDCMIDGTGFFLVGNMVNGSFTNVQDSGLSLSRIGIFSVDSNGYLVDDIGSYVYGYALEDGTGIPEKPATANQWTVKNANVTITDANGKKEISIGGVKVETTKTDFKEQVQDWIAQVTKKGGNFEGFTISLNNYDDAKNPPTVNLTITSNKSGEFVDDPNVQDEPGDPKKITDAWGNGNNTTAPQGGQAADNFTQTVIGSNRVPGVDAVYSDELSAIKIPTDPDTGEAYKIQSYKINEDGTIVGVDSQDRSITIGQLALITVENPNGLEKTSGYYYSIGPNAGTVDHMKPNGGAAGKIRGNYLEMANVDLANEFSQMITTQCGYQANSKIITVTDQMLEELVNMKR